MNFQRAGQPEQVVKGQVSRVICGGRDRERPLDGKQQCCLVSVDPVVEKVHAARRIPALADTLLEDELNARLARVAGVFEDLVDDVVVWIRGIDCH